MYPDAVVFAVAFVIFVSGSFYAMRVSSRMRSALMERHADVVARIAPDRMAHWIKHFNWQNAFNVAVAALPYLDGVDDVRIARDAFRLKVAMIVAVAALAVMLWTVVSLGPPSETR